MERCGSTVGVTVGPPGAVGEIVDRRDHASGWRRGQAHHPPPAGGRWPIAQERRGGADRHRRRRFQVITDDHDGYRRCLYAAVDQRRYDAAAYGRTSAGQTSSSTAANWMSRASSELVGLRRFGQPGNPATPTWWITSGAGTPCPELARRSRRGRRRLLLTHQVGLDNGIEEVFVVYNLLRPAAELFEQ